MPYASSIQIVNDANGAAHAFLADNGAIWQCQWNAEAQRWDKGAIVPGAFGGDSLQALYLDNLWPTDSNGNAGSQPGIVLAYRVGQGSSAEIYACFGAWGSDGQLSWSQPARLTNDQVDNQTFALVQGAPASSAKGQGQGFNLVSQVQQPGISSSTLLDKLAGSQQGDIRPALEAAASGARPDSDLYVSQWTLTRSSTGLSLQSNSGVSTALLAAAPAPAPSAAPLSLTGNTQLLRQQLVTAPASTVQAPLLSVAASGRSTAQAPLLGASGSAFNWQGYGGGATAQASLLGGSLRVGPALGQNLLRWELNIPANYQYYKANQRRRSELAGSPERFSTVSSSDTQESSDLGDYGSGRAQIVVKAVRETSASLDLSDLRKSQDLLGNLSYVRDSSNLLSPALRDDAALAAGFKLFSQEIDENGIITKTGRNLKWRGAYGGANIGLGGYSTGSASKLIYGTGNEDAATLANQGIDGSARSKLSETSSSNQWNVGAGGSLQTLYQYSNDVFSQAPSLQSVSTRESLGGDVSWRTLKIDPVARATTRTYGSVSLGWDFRQVLSAGPSGQPLPAGLAGLGYIAGLGSVAKNVFSGIGLYNAPSRKKVGGSLLRGSLSVAENSFPYNLANAVIGTTLAAIGPAAVLSSRLLTNTGDATYEKDSGLQIFGKETYIFLKNGAYGVEVNLADRFSLFPNLLNSRPAAIEDTFFANVGVALPLGANIPLLSYLHTWQSQPPQASATAASDPSSLVAAAPQTGTSAGSASLVSKGDYISAPSDTLPFLYQPASGSSSYFAPAPASNSANPFTLGQTTARLFLYRLAAYSGSVNPPGTPQDAQSAPLTLVNAGTNLVNGVYTDVPLLGVTTDGTSETAARASFTVENGSIVTSSLQISRGGSYLALPETQANSGRYILVPDVFSTGIAAPPDSSDPNLGNALANLPILVVNGANKAGSPLASQAISRIQSIGAAISVNAAVIYPQYDPSTGLTSAPPSNSNAPYSYFNVPVQLFAAAGSSPVTLLNPEAINNSLTATVHLSGGAIQSVELSAPLLIASPVSSSGYTVQLQLPEAVVSSLPAAAATPSFSVNLESTALNNFVTDDQFSSQAGLPETGIYVSAGLSDQLPLYSSMAKWPVQSRITYVTTSGGQTSIAYLNGQQYNSKTGSWQQDPVITPAQLTPYEIYTNPNIRFTAASHPTAVTIAGSGPLGGGTLAAWVEASDPVVPSTSGNGQENFQAFMQAYYGNQRLNYRIYNNGIWESPSTFYVPSGAVINHLQAFNVPNPATGVEGTLLVWSETSIAAIQGVTPDIGSATSIPTVLKAVWIDPNAQDLQPGELFSNASGSVHGLAAIATIPWDASSDVGLSINDLSIASLSQVQADGSPVQVPVLSWSQDVRTPYRQSVLEDAPLLYLQFGQLGSGLSNINIGTISDPTSTSTFASATGLNFAAPGALSKSQASAVQNIDGTGVLSTGTGTLNASALGVLKNTPASSFAGSSAIVGFTGAITDTTLSVSQLGQGSQGSLAKGAVLSGPGIAAGTTITGTLNVAADGTGTYAISQAQTVSSTAMEALTPPSPPNYSTFTASISGTTLSVDNLTFGSLSVGDVVVGEGIAPGTTITGIGTYSANSGTGTLTVDISQSVPSSSLVAVPGNPTTPYSIEFWARLPKLEAGATPSAGGLVAFGQPSETAIGKAELPQGWLLSSSFVVDQISYAQAIAKGLISAADVPSGVAETETYGWAWGLVADGADSTAMNGNGGANLYSNALQISNLASGAVLQGMSQFLANYNLTPADLPGLDGTNVTNFATIPLTQLQFEASSLNGIAIDTSSALLNSNASSLDANGKLQPVVLASSASSNLSAMFEALWNFQRKTGQAKVNFNLAPDSTSVTNSGSSAPDPFSAEQYAGYQLGFTLFAGSALSVNSAGQIVYDIGKNTSLLSSADLRDGEWHYIVASYLPTYQTYSVDNTLAQFPTNVGTASLTIDNKLVSSGQVFNAYIPSNLSDQALLLANNVGGSIDQFALYDKALTSVAFSPAAGGAQGWPTPSADDALNTLAALGYDIATKTPNPGTLPGGISSHWAARNVNPNDALLATYTSVYDAASGSWSAASTLNPLLQSNPSTPSASRPGSLQDDLVISVPTSSWSQQDWSLNSAAKGSFFDPAGKVLQGVSVTLTNLTSNTASSFQLTPDQVLIANQTLQSLQPFASASDFQYTVLSNTPAFNLLISKEQLKQAGGASNLYSASYAFSFAGGQVLSPLSGSLQGAISGNTLSVSRLNGSLRVGDLLSGSGIAAGTFITAVNKPFNATTNSGTYTVSQSQTLPSTNLAIEASINSFGSSLLVPPDNGFIGAANINAIENSSKALATAQVIEQAPLQLKYIDSGEVFRSASSAAAANAPAIPSPAPTFGQSQAIGSFSSNGINNGWIAIAQPFSTNAGSDPAGRLWIQFTGQSTGSTPSTDVAKAPTTWLNALAASNFSPDAPNLPLLGNANNPSASGGLLIQADPSAGWQQELGRTMLVADVNNDGTLDLVIGAPSANGGGRVYIVDGQWIVANLTTTSGGAILNLANPNQLGPYVTVLTPSVVNDQTDEITVAKFGSALAFDGTTLWIGAPQYARQLVPGSAKPLDSLVPIGAVYSYTSSSASWGAGTATPLLSPALGFGGTSTTATTSGSTATTYWGSELGTAIAVSSNPSGTSERPISIAVSAPGVQASLIYSGTEQVQQQAENGKTTTSPTGNGALIQIQLPSSTSSYAVSSIQGTVNPALQDVASQSAATSYQEEASTYMQNLKALQVDTIAKATLLNNQAFQAAPVGAVYLFNSSTDLAAIAAAANAGAGGNAIDAQAVAQASNGGASFYGPNPWNTLGASGFGSSLAFANLTNNSTGDSLAIGASQAGGSGAVYLVDTSQGFSAPAGWLNDINLGKNQYLAHLASSFTLYGAASADNFGNGLLNLGDVNNDQHQDLLIQAFNAASGAGNGYVVFGGDQLIKTGAKGFNIPASGNVAPSTLGVIQRADGSSFQTPILSELGDGLGAYTGQGSYGAGDANGDGLPDIPLGSGNNGSAYLTYGQQYLEAINNLQLNKLASDTGYRLQGLATTTEGSLRSIGDFNGDGYGDYLSVQPGDAFSLVRIELGASTQAVLADYNANFYSFIVANGTQVLPAGDSNGDGMTDIALFLDQNLSSGTDGNQGAGSTTGILYGRTSSNLPLGSSFGLLTPENLPLPVQDIQYGLSNASPCFLAVGDTLYAVVKSYNDNSLWFSRSNDNGNTWASWIDISASQAGISSAQSASLAFYGNQLWLAFCDSQQGISLASWSPTSGNLSSWSAPVQIAPAGSSALAPLLLSQSNGLNLYWVNQASGAITNASTTTPATSGAWSPPSALSSDAAGTPLRSATALAGTLLNGLPVLACGQAASPGGPLSSIDLLTLQSGGLLWRQSDSIPLNGSVPISAPGLTTTNTGLALTYANSDQQIVLNQLGLLQPASDSATLQPVEPADLKWQASLLPGVSSGLGSAPVLVNNTLLVGSVAADDAVGIQAISSSAAVPWLSWLNSTVQLGSSLSQRAGDASSVGVAQFGSWQDVDSGATPSQPSLASDGDTIYMAVEGTAGAGNHLFWTSSSNNGQTWNSWQELPTNLGTYAPVSIAMFNGTLYIAYVAAGSNNLEIAYNSNPASNSWSNFQIPGQSASAVTLVNEGDNLAVYFLSNANNSTTTRILKSYSSNPSSSGSWSNTSVLYDSGNNTSASQTASSNLAATRYNGQTYLAYLGGTYGSPTNTLYLTTATDSVANGSNPVWSFETTPSGINPVSTAVSNGSGLSFNLGLTSSNGGLLFSYTDSSAPSQVALQFSNADISSWQALNDGVALNASTSYAPLITASASQPLLIASGGLSNTDQNTQVQLSSLPLVLSKAQTGSTLAALGDVNADGFDDLAVTANNVAYSASGDFNSSDAQLSTGVRFLLGAATPGGFSSANSATASQQTVQIADLYNSNSLSSVTPVAALSGNGNLSLRGLQDGNLALITSTPTGSALSTASLTASATTASSLQQLFNGATASTQAPSTGTTAAGTGSPALQTLGSYGDLNGDGRLDYLAPDGLANVYSSNGAIGYDVWSLRAAGDVNGNGVDDLLLSVSPSDTNGQWLQTVLLDGSLFHIQNDQFSLGMAQGSAEAGWTSAGLKAGLNPYQYAYSDNTIPALQQWIQPILDYKPSTSLTSVTTSDKSITLNSTNNQNIFNYYTPASTVASDGTTYISSITPGSNNTAQLFYGKPSAPASDWQTLVVPGFGVPTSMAIYENTLYITYNSTSNGISICYAPLSSDLSEASNWSAYIVSTSSPNSSTPVNLPATGYPALVNEGNRLALYTQNTSGILIAVYATASPQSPIGSSSWGGTLSEGGFSGPPVTINTVSASNNTPAPLNAGTVFCATRFQGKTVLAYYQYPYNKNNDILYTAQANSDQPGSAFTSYATSLGTLDTDSSYTRPPVIHLLGSASQLYLLQQNPFNGATTFATAGSYDKWSNSVTQATNNPNVCSPFISQSQLYTASYIEATPGGVNTAPTSTSLGVAPVAIVQPPASQASLAGYSIDGNTDVNGDGFMDMLVSDPSDPSLGVNNQYAMFGGDYLNLANQVGTSGDDTLIGTPLADVIYSLAGSDLIRSNGGADVIYSGSGNDQIAITGNGFFRIDAGAGFDQLLLQGAANQAYDFRLNVPDPDYYAGTKLRNVELISSLDYGANSLYFDAAMVNAINSGHYLFLTPDSSDTISLTSEFQRNSSLDTSFAGSLWSAYTAGSKEDPDNAVLYILKPDGAYSTWLSTNVRNLSRSTLETTARQAAAAPPAAAPPSPPQPSPIASTVAFGNGLSLVAYRSTPTDQVARFAIERSNGSRRQVISYCSSTTNASAEPGKDYTPIAGLQVMEVGQTRQEFSVPISSSAFASLAGGSLSLLVQELADRGQASLHLLFEPVGGSAFTPVLSGFELTPDPGAEGGTLRFRADANGSTASLDALQLTIRQRSSAVARESSATQTVSILDAIAATGAELPAYNSVPGALALDNDQQNNGQISAQLLLNFNSTNGQPVVSLSAPALDWKPALEVASDRTLRFLADAAVTVWRSDSGQEAVSFGLEAGGQALTLLRNAVGGANGSINPGSVLSSDPLTGWRSSEGKAVGNRAVLSGLALEGINWRPTATRAGQALELLDVSLDSNQITARFSGGVSAVIGQQSSGSAPTPTPIRPSLQVQRLGRNDNGIGLYAVDDITGGVAGLHPGDPGYLEAALRSSRDSGLLLSPDQLPAFGAEASFTDLPIDPNRNYAFLLLVNNDPKQLFSSFAAANAGGHAQMINLGSSLNGLVVGFEDQSQAGGPFDGDFNDALIRISQVQVAGL